MQTTKTTEIFTPRRKLGLWAMMVFFFVLGGAAGANLVDSQYENWRINDTDIIRLPVGASYSHIERVLANNYNATRANIISALQLARELRKAGKLTEADELEGIATRAARREGIALAATN